MCIHIYLRVKCICIDLSKWVCVKHISIYITYVCIYTCVDLCVFVLYVSLILRMVVLHVLKASVDCWGRSKDKVNVCVCEWKWKEQNLEHMA